MTLKRILPTTQTILSSAEICRQRHWNPGTILESARLPKEEPGPPVRVRITAIGLRTILVWHHDEQDEIALDLHTRDWAAVG